MCNRASPQSSKHVKFEFMYFWIKWQPIARVMILSLYITYSFDYGSQSQSYDEVDIGDWK